MDRKRLLLVSLFIVLTFVLSFHYLKPADPLADETTHYPQIMLLLEGKNTLLVAEIPGYHAFMAVFGKLSGVSSLEAFRALTAFFSLMSILIFFLIAKEINRKNQEVKTLQYYLLPIAFPFFMLVYTDIFSLMLVLLSFFLILRKKYVLSGIFGMLGILIRQDNIVWLLFVLCFACYEEFSLKVNRKTLCLALRRFWVFVLGLVLFAAFFFVNKSVVFGYNKLLDWLHPSFSFHVENLFFALFIFFFLFIPLNIFNFGKIYALLKKDKKWWLITFLLFLLYMAFFVVNHPYNLAQIDFFLRHRLLSFFYRSMLLKTLLFIPIAYSLLSIAVTKLEKKSFYLLYLFSAVFLIPHWLIEQRYYIIPFAFFLLFRKHESKLVEYSLIALFLVLSAIFFFGMRNQLFFM